MTSSATIVMTPAISVTVSAVTSRRSRRSRGGSGKSSSRGVALPMPEPLRQIRVTLGPVPGARLDKALAAAVPEALALSRSRLQALIGEGAVDGGGRQRPRRPAAAAGAGHRDRGEPARAAADRDGGRGDPARRSSTRTPISSSSTSRRGWSCIPRPARRTGRWSTRCCTIAAARCRGSAGGSGRGSCTGSTRTPRASWSWRSPTRRTRGWRRSSRRTTSSGATSR